MNSGTSLCITSVIVVLSEGRSQHAHDIYIYIYSDTHAHACLLFACVCVVCMWVWHIYIYIFMNKTDTIDIYLACRLCSTLCLDRRMLPALWSKILAHCASIVVCLDRRMLYRLAGHGGGTMLLSSFVVYPGSKRGHQAKTLHCIWLYCISRVRI